MCENAISFLRGAERVPSPSRGNALLQSRALCGICGYRMQVAYGSGKTKGQTWYYVCSENGAGNGKSACQSMRGDAVDAAVSEFIVGAVNRKNLELSLMIQEQLRIDFEESDRQRQNRIEELAYKADLARRRYMEVDPSNRLVSATLEAEWESCLRVHEEAIQERETYVQVHISMSNPKLDERILALANDFRQVWNANETANEERKRLLGFLIEDITLIRKGYQVEIKLRLRGGRTHELPPAELPLPHATVSRRDASPQTLAELETLLEAGYTDRAAAQELNQRGHLDSHGKPFTKKSLYAIRARHNMENGLQRQRNKLRQQGYQSGHELASELGISYNGLRKRSLSDSTIKVHRIQLAKRSYFMYKYVPKTSPPATANT